MRPQISLILAILGCLALKAEVVTTLHCPDNQVLTCQAQVVNLSAYGDAYLMKNGVQYSAGLANVTYNTNSCNVGTIVRKWQAEDQNWNIIECSQTLTFTPGNFNQTNITWPEQEYHLEGCDNLAVPADLPSEYREPYIQYVHCAHIATSYNDVDYIFGPDCKKIIREWTVIDWCNYSPNSGGSGLYTYSQIFKVSNGVPPTLTCPKDITVNPTLCDGARVDLAWATVVGESCTGDYAVRNHSIYADTTLQDASGNYPIGTYVVPFKAEFGCGEELYCETKVTVSDIIKPVPYCLATINIVLMPVDSDGNGTVDDGMVELWAKDVNVNSYHPCNNLPLNFSFEEDITIMSKTFTCAEVGINTINMYVTDKDGNQSYCKVNVNVQNNGAAIPDCEPTIGNGMIVSGIVTGPMGDALSDTYVMTKDEQSQTVQEVNGVNTFHYASTTISESNGNFSVENVPLLRSYTIEAYKEGNTQLVTNADLDILESYIKGESEFKSPYTYLAADINEDGTVNLSDFHLLKNLQGAAEEEWPDQRQWVFLKKQSLEQHMADKPVITHMDQQLQLTDLNHNILNELHFIGILKGDLDYYESL